MWYYLYLQDGKNESHICYFLLFRNNKSHAFKNVFIHKVSISMYRCLNYVYICITGELCSLVFVDKTAGGVWRKKLSITFTAYSVSSPWIWLLKRRESFLFFFMLFSLKGQLGGSVCPRPWFTLEKHLPRDISNICNISLTNYEGNIQGPDGSTVFA